MPVAPALGHHLLDQLRLHLLLDVSEHQVGNHQVTVILEDQLRHSLLVESIDPLSGQVLDAGCLFLRIGPLLFDHADEGDDA